MFIVMKCYSGVFVSLVTIPTWQKPINTVQEIVESLNRTVVYTSRFFYDLAMAAECCDSFEYLVGENMRRHKIKRASKGNFLEKMGKFNFFDLPVEMIYINSRSIFRFYARYFKSSFHISSTNLYLDLVGILHQKDALFSAAFSKL